LLEKLIAYKCINCRAAIAHWKHAKLRHTHNNATTAWAKSAQEIFQSFFGSCTFLDTIDEMKQETMTQVPVVSTSFNLTKSFCEAGCLAPQFHPTNSGRHPLLIVGWKEAAHGEMWLLWKKTRMMFPSPLASTSVPWRKRCLPQAVICRTTHGRVKRKS